MGIPNIFANITWVQDIFISTAGNKGYRTKVINKYGQNRMDCVRKSIYNRRGMIVVISLKVLLKEWSLEE